MKLGIIGLPGAGKTTVFNALTRGDAPTGQSMGGRFEVLTAVVDVPDTRVDALSAMFRPQKTTYARVNYTDIAGLKKGIGDSGGLSGPLLNHLAAMDGFVHVVRAFEDDGVPHPDGGVDPLRDLAALDTEFLLYDMVQVEAKLERVEEGLKKGAFRDKGLAQRDRELFSRLQATLADERPLRDADLSGEERKSLGGYGLLTLKPVLVVFNIGDAQQAPDVPYTYGRSLVTGLRGKLEAELSQLSGEDLALFMEEYGVTELGLDRVIKLSYDLLGLQSFFTVSPDEVRAWTIRRGTLAVEAAAEVHTDLARGFIRAETVSYSDLVATGGLVEARAAGKMRMEGKTYPVADGDVLNIKFNL